MNTAERIYVASTFDGMPGVRLAEELARRIEDDIAGLGMTPGASLGSLRELAERYRAGRSVVREAVCILERRGLGRLRPGPCGGFILARPSPATIGAALADHFLASGITAQQASDAREAVAVLAPGSAADLVAPVLVACLDRVDAGIHGGAGIADVLAHEPSGGTRAVAIARLITAEIQRGRSAGTRLGSEWDLCERFNVSRLTLRQAIRLLQDSGLVECRRGRGNGLVIRDRRATGSIRLLLACLIGERMDPLAAGTLLFQLNACVPALAVARADATQLAQLDAALSPLEGGATFGRCELLELVHCVARLADSPVIDLFSRCLAAYEARFHPSLAERLPAAAQAGYFRLIRRLLELAKRGDLDLALAKRESMACMMEMSRQRPI